MAETLWHVISTGKVMAWKRTVKFDKQPLPYSQYGYNKTIVAQLPTLSIIERDSVDVRLPDEFFDSDCVEITQLMCHKGAKESCARKYCAGEAFIDKINRITTNDEIKTMILNISHSRNCPNVVAMDLEKLDGDRVPVEAWRPKPPFCASGLSSNPEQTLLPRFLTFYIGTGMCFVVDIFLFPECPPALADIFHDPTKIVVTNNWYDDYRCITCLWGKRNPADPFFQKTSFDDFCYGRTPSVMDISWYVRNCLQLDWNLNPPMPAVCKERLRVFDLATTGWLSSRTAFGIDFDSRSHGQRLYWFVYFPSDRNPHNTIENRLSRQQMFGLVTDPAQIYDIFIHMYRCGLLYDYNHLFCLVVVPDGGRAYQLMQQKLPLYDVKVDYLLPEFHKWLPEYKRPANYTSYSYNRQNPTTLLIRSFIKAQDPDLRRDAWPRLQRCGETYENSVEIPSARMSKHGVYLRDNEAEENLQGRGRANIGNWNVVNRRFENQRQQERQKRFEQEQKRKRCVEEEQLQLKKAKITAHNRRMLEEAAKQHPEQLKDLEQQLRESIAARQSARSSAVANVEGQQPGDSGSDDSRLIEEISSDEDFGRQDDGPGSMHPVTSTLLQQQAPITETFCDHASSPISGPPPQMQHRIMPPGKGAGQSLLTAKVNGNDASSSLETASWAPTIVAPPSRCLL